MTLPLVVVASRIAFNLRNSASVDQEPEEVVISNLSDTSATISWYTNEITSGVIQYGTDPTQLNLSASDDRDDTSVGNYSTHYVVLRNLSPNTVYHFEIVSGSENYSDVSGSPYFFRTLSTAESPPSPSVLYGSVNPDITDGIIYAYASDGNKVSTVASVLVTSGNYAIPKTNMKDPTTGAIFDFSGADIIISATDSEGNRGRIKFSGASDEERVATANLSPSGELFDQDDVFAVTENNGGGQVTPTTDPGLGDVNADAIINDKISFGTEETNPTVPYSIFMSNISSSGFCVNWLTKQATVGQLLYQREGQENLRVLDERDTPSAQQKRYTHTTCVSAGDFVEGEKVGFYMYSNNSPFGVNLTTQRYVFAMPPITDSPPSPGSVQGNVNRNFEQISEVNNRDLLITGRYFDSETQKSTWVSAVPSSTSSTNWSLDYTSILDLTLDDFFNASNSNFDIELHSEYNGFTSTSITDNTDVVSLEVDTGLAVTSTEHNSRLTEVDELIGTAPPNSSVNIEINNQSFSATSDSIGRWNINFGTLTKGNYSVSSTSSDEVLGLSFTVAVDGDIPTPAPLPDTSLDTTNIIPLSTAAFLLFGGIIIRQMVTSRRQGIDSL